ncbi:MAG: hypothetical protein J6S75_11190, partial [Thermoguttaceae bacterium]|nr:hypothetical protein [Thermoguttaceae bacterium]
PEYADAFGALPFLAMEKDPNRPFLELLGENADRLAADWQNFVEWLDYGFDFDHAPNTNIPSSELGPLPDGGISLTLDAENGYLATGLVLEPGKEYSLSASGRFRVGCRGKVYPCEANGITLSYFNTRPLGTLLAEIIPEKAPLGELPIQTEPIGVKGTFTPQKGGELRLRLNLPTDQIKNSRGTCTVTIRL